MDKNKSVFRKLKKVGPKRALSILIHHKLDKQIRRFFGAINRSQPLEDTIVIESHNDFDCNGGAFYRYLINNGYNKKYKIVWLLKNKESMRMPLPENVISFPLHRFSIKRARVLSRARIFTSDNEITDKIRDDQISIYFDHGPFGLKNVKPFFALSDSVDYFLSSSKNYDPIFCDQMSKPYPNNKMIHLGYPMHDVFYEKTEDEVQKITTGEYHRTVLWMPTFRKGGGYGRNDSHADYPLGIPLIKTLDELKLLEKTLEHLNILLIIKLHPMQEIDLENPLFTFKSNYIKILTGKDVKHLKVDNYRLLKGVHALISDYSSIAYSFILLDRPMAFFLGDASDLKYGFSVENPDFFLTGDRIYSLEQMLTFIEDVSKGEDRYRTERRKLCDWLHEYKDGNSSKRIVEFLGL